MHTNVIKLDSPFRHSVSIPFLVILERASVEIRITTGAFPFSNGVISDEKKTNYKI